MRQPHGLFGWVDLGSTDVPAAKAFYEALFGWETTDIPTPMGVDYTMCSKDGKRVAGIGPLPQEMVAAGAPSLWNSYVLVENVDDVLAKVESAGGFVAMPPIDVMTEGRMAMIGDPSGAIVGLWEPRDHQGADLFNTSGALVWNELQSRDRDAATSFYADIFGWTWRSMGGGDDDPEYFIADVAAKEGDDKSNCGAMSVPPDAPAKMPSTWFAYFAVADCDAAVGRATELGGRVFVPAMDMGPGRFAGVTDPAGGMFMVMSYAGSDATD